jgi:NTE family protein
MESLGSARSYHRLEGSIQGATSWGASTINYAVSGGTDLDSELPAYESFTLGGPLRLSGYRVNQFSGSQYAFGRLMYYRQAVRLPDILGSGVYFGGSAEVGRISGRSSGLADPGTLWSGSVFLGADTFLGPLYLGFGAGGSGHWSLYLLLGRP